MPLLATAALSLLLLSAYLAPGSQDRASASGARTRDVYVAVVDSKGAPVQGLTASDFGVREDRVAREVLKAEPATAPLQVALLIDDSQAATSMIQPLRDGISGFIDQLQGKAEIALITFGERPTTLVEYTSETPRLKKGVGRIFARPGSGPYFLDADPRREPRPPEEGGRTSRHRRRDDRGNRVRQPPLSDRFSRHSNAAAPPCTCSPLAHRPTRWAMRCATGTS